MSPASPGRPSHPGSATCWRRSLRTRRRDAFFRIWTRKEAYVKARGEGLSYPTRSFTMTHHGDDNALVDDERDERARDRWRVTGLDAPPGFAAALAAEGRGRTVSRFDAALLPR